MERSIKPNDFSRKRKLNEVLKDSYKILTENYKLVLKLAACWLVISLVLNIGMFISRLYEPLLIFMVNSDISYLQALSVFIIIGSMILGFLVFTFYGLLPIAFIKCYMNKEGSSLTLNGTIRQVIKDFPKGLLLFFLSILLLVLTLPVSLYTIIPLSFVLIAYLVQGRSLGKAFKEGFSLGSRYWARSIALSIIVSILCSVIVFVFYIPVLILLYVLGNALVAGNAGEEVLLPGYFWFLLLLSLLIYQIGSFIAMFYTNTAGIMQYFNVKTRREECLSQRSSRTDQI